jgi:FG-GAP-like repeat
MQMTTRGTLMGCLLAAASAPVCAQLAFQAQTAITTGPAPNAIAVGDFNRDGKLDLAVAMQGNGRVYIYNGNGAGVFSFAVSYVVGTNPFAILATDLNGDGKLDLAVTNSGSATVSILIGHGDGAFNTAIAYPVGLGPISIAADSFNPDGYVDLVTANGTNICTPPLSPCGSVTLLRNNGDGTFYTGATLYPQVLPSKLTTGAFTAGGDSDIVVTSHGGNQVVVYLGDGGGAFPTTHAFVTSNPYAVVSADFDRDGKIDLAMSRYDFGDVSLQRGIGDGTFQPGAIYSEGASDAHPIDAATGDFDGDSFPDLVIANYSDNSVAVLRDRTVGNGGFFAALTFTGGLNFPTSVAVGDFNSDGKPDFVVANSGGNSLSVFLNASIPIDRLFANGFE